MVELDASLIAGEVATARSQPGRCAAPERKVEEATAVHLPGREGALLLANVIAQNIGNTLKNSCVATVRAVISFTS
ncbi:hypothetical protein XCR_1493 [Xanthomonas campestris pv. raphani 756C]|nr:hypothetical protein XCR_1493 [Xanthomonas campestris pv. raphani 756C]